MLLMMMIIILVEVIRIVTRTYHPAMEDHLEALVRMTEDLLTSGMIGLSLDGRKILQQRGFIRISFWSNSYKLYLSSKPKPVEKKKSGVSKSKDQNSLIDFDNNTSKSKSKDDGWNNNWEDDAWESLNN